MDFDDSDQRTEMETKEKKYFERIVEWREKHLTEQQFVIVLAFVTGLLGAAKDSYTHSSIGSHIHLSMEPTTYTCSGL